MKYGDFVTQTVVHPTIEIDCQDGTHEYCEPAPPGGLKLGKFVTHAVVHPTIHMEAESGITLLVDVEAGVDPNEALIHVGRVIQQVQDLDPELKLHYESSRINDREHIEIHLVAGLKIGAERRLTQLAERLRREPVVAKPAQLKVEQVQSASAGNGAKT